MIKTPIARPSVPTSRALSPMPFPTAARTSVHVDPTPNVTAYDATAHSATTTDTTIVVNPWLGGGTCGDQGTGISWVGTSFGFASKRNAPGRLEGMT